MVYYFIIITTITISISILHWWGEEVFSVDRGDILQYDDAPGHSPATKECILPSFALVHFHWLCPSSHAFALADDVVHSHDFRHPRPFEAKIQARHVHHVDASLPPPFAPSSHVVACGSFWQFHGCAPSAAASFPPPSAPHLHITTSTPCLTI